MIIPSETKDAEKSGVGELQEYLKVNFPPALPDEVFEVKRT